MVDTFDNWLVVGDGKNINGFVVELIILRAPQVIEIAGVFSIGKLAILSADFARLCTNGGDIADSGPNRIGVTLTVLCSSGKEPKVHIG